MDSKKIARVYPSYSGKKYSCHMDYMGVSIFFEKENEVKCTELVERLVYAINPKLKSKD